MSQLSLKTILVNYEQLLCRKHFIYELDNEWSAKLAFYVEDFCHLIGLHHVYVGDKRFLGINGYNLIMSNALTINSLIQHNKKGYNYIKDKIFFFDSLVSLGAYIMCISITYFQQKVGLILTNGMFSGVNGK